MSRRNELFKDAKVYVGGLPEDARSEEVEEAFQRFGRIRKVWVARRPPGFAFVEFEDSRDAEDAVHSLQEKNRICGVRARVELSHGGRRSDKPGGGDRRNGNRDDRRYGGGDSSRRGRRYSRSRSRSLPRGRSRSPRGSPRYNDRRDSRSLSR